MTRASIDISYSSAYLKKVVAKLKEGGADEAKVKDFQTKVQNYYTKKIAPNFGDFDFYTGESMDPDGMYVVAHRLIIQVTGDC